jgi:hypothetical protein
MQLRHVRVGDVLRPSLNQSHVSPRGENVKSVICHTLNFEWDLAKFILDFRFHLRHHAVEICRRVSTMFERGARRWEWWEILSSGKSYETQIIMIPSAYIMKRFEGDVKHAKLRRDVFWDATTQIVPHCEIKYSL